MAILTTLLILSLASYIFLGLLLRGNIQAIPIRQSSWQPTVSIVVAVRNEEKYLRDCLTSLSRIDYPEEKLDIIVVDDASSDGSTSIIESFAKNFNVDFVRLEEGQKEKPGKAGALLAGIEKSRGEIVFITDADCIVPQSWVRDMLAGFHKRTGIVGGFTLLQPPVTIFEKLQAMDWFFLLSVASAASQFNKPITWVGNNLAVRRAAYDQVGGYRQLGESFVEDFALIDAVDRETEWQCRFYASPGSLVRTHAATTWNELYTQRKRWGLGVSSARPFGLWIMWSGFLVHLFLIVSIFFSFPLAILALIVKIGMDFLILQRSRHILKESFRTAEFLLYEPYYILYSMVLPLFLLIDRQVIWKGAELSRD